MNVVPIFLKWKELWFFFLPEDCSINKWQNFMFTHMVFWFPADDNIREETDNWKWVAWGLGGPFWMACLKINLGDWEKTRLRIMQGKTETVEIHDLRDQGMFCWRQWSVNGSVWTRHRGRSPGQLPGLYSPRKFVSLLGGNIEAWVVLEQEETIR